MIATRAEPGTGNVIGEVREETGMLEKHDRVALGDHSKDFAIHLE